MDVRNRLHHPAISMPMLVALRRRLLLPVLHLDSRRNGATATVPAPQPHPHCATQRSRLLAKSLVHRVNQDMAHRPDPPSTDVPVTARQNTVSPQSSALHVISITDCGHVAVAHHGHGICTPSIAQSASFGPSSRTNSSSSLLPGMARPGSSAGSSHQHQVRYERRPSLRQNPAWQGSFSSATGSTHSRACLSFPSLNSSLISAAVQMQAAAWIHTE